MTKKCLVSLLALLLIHCACLVQSTQAQSEKEVRAASKAKAKISKLSSPGQTLVEVTQRDGVRIVGYLTEVAADHFVVTDYKTSGATTIAYSDLKQVEKVERLTTARKAYLVFALAGLGLAVAGLAAALIHPE